MVLAHLTRILPSRRRVLSRGDGRDLRRRRLALPHPQLPDARSVFSELYVTTLAPPALRLAPAVATTRFIDEARALKAVLDAHMKDEDAGDPSQE